DTVKPLARVTKNGIRSVLANEAYLGEAERTRKEGEPQEFDRKGKPKSTTTIRNAHEPLVTVAQWEAAQAAGGKTFCANNGRWSSQVRLAGLVYCEEGHRLKTGAGGSNRHAVYTCTTAGCKHRATIDAKRLDEWVENLLVDAAYAREPHVGAILEGDDRYARALAELEDAQRELDTYTENVKISLVGPEKWERDVRTRTAAVGAARTALKNTSKPPSSQKVVPISEKIWNETDPADRAKIVDAALERE